MTVQFYQVSRNEYAIALCMRDRLVEVYRVVVHERNQTLRVEKAEHALKQRVVVLLRPSAGR